MSASAPDIDYRRIAVSQLVGSFATNEGSRGYRLVEVTELANSTIVEFQTSQPIVTIDTNNPLPGRTRDVFQTEKVIFEVRTEGVMKRVE